MPFAKRWSYTPGESRTPEEAAVTPDYVVQTMDRVRFLELVEPIIQLLEKKHQDYNTGVKLEDYFPFGPQSYAQMIHVKTLRLISLYQNNRPVNFESAEDTVKDLINYTVFFLDYLDKVKNEQV